MAAAHLALDSVRALKVAANRDTELGDCLFDPQARSPESYLTCTRYQGVFRRAVQDAVTALSAHERNLLRLHVVGRCTIDRIGCIHGVHRATAARWLERARSRVFELVRRQLAAEDIELTDRELRSIARVVGAELELGTWSGLDDSVGTPNALGPLERHGRA